MDLLTAALTDRYRIERELGQGGMATVYLAEDQKHRRKVAVKVLRPELAATMGSERFAREIAVAAQLQHPHILGLLDSGESDGFFYYVMPFVEGETLRTRLDRGGELPVHEAVRLLGEIADALAAAHRAGVVHRDIKPENILLTGRHAMVMDFGVAKAVSEATGAHQLTSVGVALGTPAYMAPEQATADPSMDGRVDIYALGVLAYEMLTGQPPFHGLNPQQTLAAHVTQSPTPLGQRRPGLSPALEQVVMTCLAKRPADRYQTADALVAELEPLTTPSGGLTPHATMPYPQATNVSPSGRRIAWLIAGAAGLAVVAWLVSRALRQELYELQATNIRQITRDPIVELAVSISPDGREVTYQAGHTRAATHIEVRDVEGGRPLSLTEDWSGAQILPRWHPDGRSIVLFNLRTTPDHAAGFWKVPRLGGPAVSLDSADAARMRGGTVLAVRGDSQVIITRDGREGPYPDVLANATGPAWRADGSAVAFVVGVSDLIVGWGNVAPSAIWVMVPGKTPVQVTEDTHSNRSPAWLPDGSLLYVSNHDGSSDLWMLRIDSDGTPREPAQRITTGLEARSVAVSADGTRAAYDRFILRQNIYAIPIPALDAVSVSNARPITSGNQTIENIDVSSDGKWLVFDSNVEGKQQIFVMPATGGEARQVTRSTGDNFSPDFAPDGLRITYHSTRNATRDIYVINADGSGEMRLTSDAGQSYNPAFSPEGRRIAYGDLTGTFSGSLYLLERAGPDGPWNGPTLLAENGFGPRWSPDGTTLIFYLATSADYGSGLSVMQPGGTPRPFFVPSAELGRITFPEWALDGKSVYFRAFDANDTEGIYQIPATGGTPRLLVRFDVPNLRPFLGAPVVANGMFYFVLGEAESDIYVMDLVRK